MSKSAATSKTIAFNLFPMIPQNQNQTPSLPFQVGNYVLTSEQTASMLSVSVNWNVPVSELLKGAGPEFGNPATACLMVPIPGKSICLGIERNGYTHS